MSDHDQTIEDARRYVELVNSGGWRDPDVDPTAMLTAVLEAHEAIIPDECDDAATNATDEMESDHKELIVKLLVKLKIGHDENDDYETLVGLLGEAAEAKLKPLDSSELLELLGQTIERERHETIEAYRKSDEFHTQTLNEKIAAQDDQIALLRAEIRTLKDSPPPKPARKRRGVSPG